MTNGVGSGLRLIIAGSRTLSPTVEEIDAGFDNFVFCAADVVEVVSGCAPGVDRAGEAWATARKKKLVRFPIIPDDARIAGERLAPKMRNRRMAQYADGALLFWDALSGGTSDMCMRMVVRQLPVIVIPMKRRK